MATNRESELVAVPSQPGGNGPARPGLMLKSEVGSLHENDLHPLRPQTSLLRLCSRLDSTRGERSMRKLFLTLTITAIGCSGAFL